MTFGQSIDFLQSIEAKHDLLQYRFDGWSVWCVLRFPVQLALVSSGTLTVPRVPYRDRLALAGGDALRLLTPCRCRHLVKTYSSGLVERAGKRYKDIWFDDLIGEVGSTFKIEQVNNPAFMGRRAEALVPSDMTTSAVELLASSIARLRRPASVEVLARQLCEVLNRELGTDAFTAEWAGLRLRLFLVQKRIYRWLFRRIRPSYLLVADPGEHASIAAAKELGVTAVELQHGGTTDRYHSGYSWTTYGLSYRERMPIPDRLFLYGEHTRREIDRYGFWGNAIRVVGCPRVDQYRLRRFTREPEGFMVLLTTGASVREVIAFIGEFLRSARDLTGMRLFVKLHPVYESSPDPYLEAFGSDSRVKILLGSEDPSTFELLSQAAIHVSVSSSCHYDAVGLGVPTVILALPTHEIVLPLRDAGHALFARTPAELTEIVGRWRSLRVPEAVSEYYFRPASIRNMIGELGGGAERTSMNQGGRLPTRQPHRRA